MDNCIEIVGKNYYGSYKYTRYACRGIVIQGENILLSYATKKDFWMLPGGGKEENETDLECAIREVLEETGYVVTSEKPAVEVVEYYEDTCYVSQYFICKITGESETQLTQEEKETGLERRWIPLKEAMLIFSKHEQYRNSYEEKRGAYLREYSALLKMLENKDIKDPNNL